MVWLCVSLFLDSFQSCLWCHVEDYQKVRFRCNSFIPFFYGIRVKTSCALIGNIGKVVSVHYDSLLFPERRSDVFLNIFYSVLIEELHFFFWAGFMSSIFSQVFYFYAP